MNLHRLAAHGEKIAERAEERAKRQIMARTNLPEDVQLSSHADGLVLSGRALRRRMIDDPRLRNISI